MYLSQSFLVAAFLPSSSLSPSLSSFPFDSASVQQAASPAPYTQHYPNALWAQQAGNLFPMQHLKWLKNSCSCLRQSSFLPTEGGTAYSSLPGSGAEDRQQPSRPQDCLEIMTGMKS